MKKKTLMAGIALCVLANGKAGAATRIRGFVLDASTSQPLQGVSVVLQKTALQGITDAQGHYLLSDATTSLPRATSGLASALRIEGGFLVWEVPEGRQMPAALLAIDPSGRSVTLFAGNAGPGRHAVELGSKLRGSGVWILQSTLGAERSTRILHSQGRRWSLSCNTEIASASLAAARATATVWDTLVVSKSGYTTVKAALATSTDSVGNILLKASTASLVPEEASLSAAPIGFANYGTNYATAISGGGTATATTVTTCADLKAAAADKNPRVILISGTIKTSDCNGGYGLPIASNKTVMGADKNATVYGGLYVNSGVSNVIIRNLNCHGIYPNSGADDAIHVQGATHVWLDHLNLWDATDGNLDITEMADYVTVSWCKFWYTLSTHPHRLCALIGSGGGDHPDDWGKLHVTYHHNWFSTLVNERMPRLMYGTAHVYNDYYTSSGNGYCIGFGSYGTILVENNYFKDVANPISYMYDVYAWIVQRGNSYNNTTGTGPSLSGKQGSRAVTGQDYAVTEFKTAPYTYVLDKAADVPGLVGVYAGPQ